MSPENASAPASGDDDPAYSYKPSLIGAAWQLPLLALPKTTFLLMSATLGDTTAIREDLAQRTGRPVA